MELFYCHATNIIITTTTAAAAAVTIVMIIILVFSLLISTIFHYGVVGAFWWIVYDFAFRLSRLFMKLL